MNHFPAAHVVFQARPAAGGGEQNTVCKQLPGLAEYFNSQRSRVTLAAQEFGFTSTLVVTKTTCRSIVTVGADKLYLNSHNFDHFCMCD